MVVNKNKIAILLSVYNGKRYLKEQLDSILNQSFKDWTLYIRDDRSTDSSLEIIEEYVKHYDQIYLFDLKSPNLGPRDSFLFMLNNIESDYYMFADQDDIWLPNKVFLSITKLIAEEKRVAADIPLLVCTDVSLVDKDLNLLDQSQWNSIGINPQKFVSYKYLLSCPCILGMTMCFNKYLKKFVFPVSTYIGMHDSWLAYLAAKNGQILYVTDQTVLYRQHESNVCGIDSQSHMTLLYKMKHIKETYNQNFERYLNVKHIENVSLLEFFYFKFSNLLYRYKQHYFKKKLLV